MTPKFLLDIYKKKKPLFSGKYSLKPERMALTSMFLESLWSSYLQI